MPGIAWIILNAVLVVAAIGGTVAVKRRPAPVPVALEESAAKSDDGKKAAAANAPAASTKKVVAASNGLPADASLDDLWRHTLFLPTREEIEATEGGMSPEEAARAAALAAQKIDFELIGIAQMASPGKEAEPVALLRNKVASNGRAQGRRFGNGQPGRPGSPGNNAAVPNVASSAPTQLVFRVGEMVNSTGYKVKSIDVANRAVEVERGAEVVKLTINFTSEEANQRRNAVAAQENIRRQQVAAEAARTQQQAAARNVQAAPGQAQPTAVTNNQPQPNRTVNGAANNNATTNNLHQNVTGAAASQPPAGPPGTAQGTTGRTDNRSGSVSSMSAEERAERIRRAMEARQRAARQNGSSTQQQQ